MKERWRRDRGESEVKERWRRDGKDELFIIRLNKDAQ